MSPSSRASVPWYLWRAALAVTSVYVGGYWDISTVMLLLAFMNRATETLRRSLQWLFLYVGGTIVCESLLLKLEYIDRSDMHSALFYSAVVLGTA